MLRSPLKKDEFLKKMMSLSKSQLESSGYFTSISLKLKSYLLTWSIGEISCVLRTKIIVRTRAKFLTHVEIRVFWNLILILAI
jgi:hypothetical protein